MLLRQFLSIGAILLSGSLLAQSNTLSSGGNATGTNGSVSYSIGQIDYISASGSNGNLNQGVQQPFEFYQTSGLEEYTSLLELTIGPNPTSDVLYLNLKDQTNQEFFFKLIDDHGKIMISSTKLETKNELSLKELPSAMYQLVITSGEQEIKTYKIIKH
jgi:hypothetical protein